MALGRRIGLFFWTIIGLFCIGASPALFKGVSINLGGFFHQIILLFQDCLKPWDIEYINPDSGMARSLFPDFFTPLSYSLILIFGALIASFILSMIFSTTLIFLKEWVLNGFKGIFFVFESLPDIFVIVIMQFFLVWFYQKTGVLLMKFVSFGDDRLYMLPILVMSILPTVYLTKIMLINLDREMDEPYVEFAKSKGLAKPIIIFRHIVRNTIMSAFNHSKTVTWLLVSNLLMVEYFYNAYGVTWFILNYYQPEVLTIGLISLFVPLFIFQTVAEVGITKITGQGKVDQL